MSEAWLSETTDGVLVRVFVVPRASKTSIEGEHDERLRVRVAAPPVDGAANQELIRFFAQTLKVAKSDVSVEQGTTGRRKTLKIRGASMDALRGPLVGAAQ